MLWSLQKLILLLSLVIAANAIFLALPENSASAATEKKKAKWQSPPKTANTVKKEDKKKKTYKNRETVKKIPTKKNAPAKKAALVKDVKKAGNKSLVKSTTEKDVAKKKEKATKPTEKTLIVDHDFQDDGAVLSEERSTSPLLIVFVTFVICCVGGMLFLNKRKRQLAAAKSSFQEASNHELAFSSNHERLDSSQPTHSGHETPNTRILFEGTDKHERSSAESPPKVQGFLGKISNMAVSLFKSGDAKSGNQKKTKVLSMQFDNEDLGVGSITAIGAVKSKHINPTSKPPVAFNADATLTPMPTNIGVEPCSFENYIEIQIATQCWRAQKLSLDTKLRATFNIDTTTLIQYEYYWKQKISNNINLKKKYQELEPLFTAKYEAAS